MKNFSKTNFFVLALFISFSLTGCYAILKVDSTHKKDPLGTGEKIMEKEIVVIHVAGSEYSIRTEEDPAYVEALAETLDQDITAIVQANRRLSMTQAAILAALDYADKAAKESEAADNLRNQIKEYLEDSARYKMEAEVARRDVERLQKELAERKRQPF